jgi:hypothetical protein
MDALTFITDLVDSLAWPLAAVVVVALLRPAIGDLLRQLRSVTVPGLGAAVFGVELARGQVIADESETIEPSQLVSSVNGEQEIDEIVRLAAFAPRAAVIEAWGEVEAAARYALDSLSGSEGARPPTAARLGEILTEQEVLDEPGSRLFAILRGLRNRVAHEPHYRVEPDEALDYVRLARGLAQRLRGDEEERNERPWHVS